MRYFSGNIRDSQRFQYLRASQLGASFKIYSNPDLLKSVQINLGVFSQGYFLSCLRKNIQIK